ncbi:MAG: YafY family transcriptional regulator [Gammaproteobacteria bacterium]|nr:YafY family transcriptional regulator [Gammaproteobacteria bacterium]
MDKFDRIYALHALLSHSRLPITKAKIEEQLECSHATAERLIKDMRLYLNAPIEYNREANGYFYNKNSQYKYELPGLWFNASELYALLITYQLLSSVGPGLLDAHISPLKIKIEELLGTDKIAKGELAKRVRIIKIASRKPNPKHFSLVATSLLTRKRLFIEYQGRERGKPTKREISPQRLIYYRDNWYLDAWCHLRNELRSFAIERIDNSKFIIEESTDIDDSELEAHYASSYGIFAGKPTHTALLKFSKDVAQWVADEQWHPKQKGQFTLDGSYELEIPYRDPRELMMDILKYGADVEVLKPSSLRSHIQQKLQQAVTNYTSKEK